MIKIYNFARGVRGLRIMWQCEEMGLPYEHAVLTFPTSSAYRALNPMGSVPFMEDSTTGASMSESIAIMLYLATQYGPTPLLPSSSEPAKLARVMQMVVFSEATLGAWINSLIAARFAAPEADKANWTVRGIESRMNSALAYVEEVLGDKPFIADTDLTLADLTTTTALGMWVGALNKPLSEKLTEYRARLAERPEYQRALAICNDAATTKK